MWSHYANRHKGVALEFDVLDSVAHPIAYRINRYSLNYEKLATGLDREDIEGLWLTKYVEWEYEKEVRVILRKSECRKEGDMYFYELGKDISLKGIVLGPICEIPIQSIENSLPKASKLTVIKARLAFRSFNSVRKKDFETVHPFLNDPKHLDEVQGIKRKMRWRGGQKSTTLALFGFRNSI